MRILVVEDDQKIAAAIKRGLELKSYAVDVVHDGDTGLSYATDADYDVVILDRMIPGSIDGVGIVKRMRESRISTPVLMLTARGTIGDKVEGLNSGADDYLVKPFSFDELTARIQALLRRRPEHTGTIMKVGDLELDTNSYQVHRGNAEIKLSAKEYALLEYLMHHEGQVVTKDMIINHVWDEDAYVLPNTVEVYIGYLRNKIDRPYEQQGQLLHTIRGFGYKLHAVAA
jgi:DNA-binding response OmpR family regulator